MILLGHKLRGGGGGAFPWRDVGAWKGLALYMLQREKRAILLFCASQANISSHECKSDLWRPVLCFCCCFFGGRGMGYFWEVTLVILVHLLLIFRFHIVGVTKRKFQSTNGSLIFLYRTSLKKCSYNSITWAEYIPRVQNTICHCIQTRLVEVT